VNLNLIVTVKFICDFCQSSSPKYQLPLAPRDGVGHIIRGILNHLATGYTGLLSGREQLDGRLTRALCAVDLAGFGV